MSKGDMLPEVDIDRMEELRKMMAPLSKEQVVEVLARAAATHNDVLETIHQTVNDSPASRRLMIRNIAFCTSNEALYNKFLNFGEIEDYTIVREKDTNRSKGFGFVTFKRAESVQAALKVQIQIDGRQLAVKLAADPIEESAGDSSDSKLRRKLFIRNLSDSTSTQTLRTFFEQFGPIEDAVVVKGPDGASKGFGFVTFHRAEDSKRAAQQQQRIIDGRMAFVSFASPSSGVQKNVGGMGGAGMMQMGGGPMGGAGFGNFAGGPGMFGNQGQNPQAFNAKRSGSDAMGFFRQQGGGSSGGQFVGLPMGGQTGGGGGQSGYVDQNQYLQQLQAMHAMQLGMTQLPPQYASQHAAGGPPNRF
eukprot:GHVQ01025023.1.p1 GENE.GHVQ01025023.1~~GHVQ01025023.1.p1  ORF type:complete len:360 (+),score=59.94 GHVQ01025023.1:3529-4608(+)